MRRGQNDCMRGSRFTHEETDRTFDSTSVDAGFGLWGILCHAQAFGLGCLVGCVRASGGMFQRGIGIWELLASCQNLFIVPGAAILFERAIKWGELARRDELGHDGLVVIFRCGIDTLRGEIAIIDGIFELSAT